MNKYLKQIKRIFLLSLPILGFGLANIMVMAHARSFCLVKLIFGHECWGCGLTRAFAALGRLDFKAAYEFNHLIIFFAPFLFVVWIILLKQEFKTK